MFKKQTSCVDYSGSAGLVRVPQISDFYDESMNLGKLPSAANCREPLPEQGSQNEKTAKQASHIWSRPIYVVGRIHTAQALYFAAHLQ